MAKIEVFLLIFDQNLFSQCEKFPDSHVALFRVNSLTKNQNIAVLVVSVCVEPLGVNWWGL